MFALNMFSLNFYQKKKLVLKCKKICLNFKGMKLLIKQEKYQTQYYKTKFTKLGYICEK